MKYILIILASLTLLLSEQSKAESNESSAKPLAYCDEFTFCFEVVYIGGKDSTEMELHDIIEINVDGEWTYKSPNHIYRCGTFTSQPPTNDLYIYLIWYDLYQLAGYTVNGENYKEINDSRFKKEFIVYNAPDSCSLNVTFYVDDITYTLERTMLVNNGEYIPKSLVKDSDIALVQDLERGDKGRFVKRFAEEGIISGKEYIKSITNVYEYYADEKALHYPKVRASGPFSLRRWLEEWEGDSDLWFHSNWVPEIGYVTIPMDKDRKCVYAFKLDNLNSVSLTFESQDFSFYPNPATDVLHISPPRGISSGKLSISDLAGRIVYEQALRGGDLDLSLGAFSSGVYFISFYANNSVTSKQLIIIK